MKELASKSAIFRVRQQVRPHTGLYFLLLGDQIVYVGQALNYFTRVATHINYPDKAFDAFSFIAAEKWELAYLEAAYIKKFKPIYNVAHGGAGAKGKRDAFHASVMQRSNSPQEE